ncbi:MAG TPA: hypothetical protein ENI87_12990 [bacterium]|nr:hypothetical protein [bacterium]
MLLRALVQTIAAVAVVGAGVGALSFSGEGLLAAASLPYYVAGLCGAGFAMLATVWLHGRFAATAAPADADRADFLVAARLQTLLAAALGVKLAVLVVGFLLLKRFPLGPEPAKFSDIATFGVTFAAASLLCQLGTAFALARALRRRAPAA